MTVATPGGTGRVADAVFERYTARPESLVAFGSTACRFDYRLSKRSEFSIRDAKNLFHGMILQLLARLRVTPARQ
jgi:hypothetical protein